MTSNLVFHGDCLDVIKELIVQDVKVDSIVTDPPYELGFMGKDWDKTGIAYNKELWELCLKILKPGGHLLAFGGARTYHIMASAIEDAGFEIRDQIMWLYGSGFPKSLNVSKQIDKRGGTDISWFGSWLRTEREKRGIKQKELSFYFPSKTGGLTGCVANWELGLNLPTAEQFNKLCEVLKLPFDKVEEAEQAIIGSIKTNLTPYRKIGEVNISGEINITVPATNAAKQWNGWGSALKPAHEPIVLARKPLLEPTIAANVLKHGTGAINIDGCRVASTDNTVQGRFPANLIHDGSEEVAAEFAKYGERKSGHKKPLHTPTNINDFAASTGTADRFFYCAKASKKERNGSKHPTVKPVALMRYLCRLITPPGGIILDPFAGSGTTGQAAIEEGFSAILIEKEPEYINDIKNRESTLYDRQNT
jgi:DNA modification methylase/transcriptional regulator with XRE-family HTH domain